MCNVENVALLLDLLFKKLSVILTHKSLYQVYHFIMSIWKAFMKIPGNQKFLPDKQSHCFPNLSKGQPWMRAEEDEALNPVVSRVHF